MRSKDPAGGAKMKEGVYQEYRFEDTGQGNAYCMMRCVLGKDTQKVLYSECMGVFTLSQMKNLEDFRKEVSQERLKKEDSSSTPDEWGFWRTRLERVRRSRLGYSGQ